MYFVRSFIVLTLIHIFYTFFINFLEWNQVWKGKVLYITDIMSYNKKSADLAASQM